MSGSCLQWCIIVSCVLTFLLIYMQPGSVYVSQTLKFILPVYIGDEVLAEVEATYLREHKKRYMYDVVIHYINFKIYLYLFLEICFCNRAV